MLSHKPLTDPENEPGGNVDKGGSDTEAAASLRVLLHPHSILDRVGGSLLEFVCIVKHSIDDRRTFFLVACVLRHDAGTREALIFLEKECTALEAALYKLQEQEGGAPKVFLEEMREAKPQSDMMDGDDEVVVIGINRASFKTMHASGGRHRGEATKNDVIEIDG